ncbi:YpiF family protein [Aquibacillus sp. 3ASR75-11]|uniref:YpiF family protein n=1 Tax=Terrihalobacillus insolitus TaxID=2950438 RepID=A0A9X3WWP5_9BACI|nr:DUF2487 family protein [Terrihalobacillus insolitus]MDC3413042.1 YpiF family protein [Terrihalobacillus insolitus]MDC3424784.1 YpiF family protein [Terrihalobacillus insolitus]
MQWSKKDMEQYIGAKEYVDTVLIPLMPVVLAGNEELVKQAFQGELLNRFSQEVEVQFKGRIYLSPIYTYLASANKISEAERLKTWVDGIKENEPKHIFFFTFDPQWKKHEKNLDGTIIWIPAIQTGDIHSQETKDLLKQQTSQLTELILSYW